MVKVMLWRARHELRVAAARVAAGWYPADISVFHEFSPSPGGGGHQFLRALWGEFERRGYRVENNRLSRTTRACLFNSFNFDFALLRRLKRAGCRMVHRVDGPICAYRGRDDGSDRRITEINRELADATVFQSRYSAQKHMELGFELREPYSVIRNAVDAAIFHDRGRDAFDPARKTRLISSSWSDNPNKGAPIYQWLDEHLDFSRHDYTFVGRPSVRFRNIRMVAPVPSQVLADLLRQHDVFIAASLNEPCSNALTEALSCGLPAIYRESGGNAEVVGDGGLGFKCGEEIPSLLGQITNNYQATQSRIAVPTIGQVADQYLAALELQLVSRFGPAR